MDLSVVLSVCLSSAEPRSTDGLSPSRKPPLFSLTARLLLWSWLWGNRWQHCHCLLTWLRLSSSTACQVRNFEPQDFGRGLVWCGRQWDTQFIATPLPQRRSSLVACYWHSASPTHLRMPLFALIFMRRMREPTESITLLWFILQLCSVCLMWAGRLVALQPPGCCWFQKTLHKIWRNDGCVYVEL